MRVCHHCRSQNPDDVAICLNCAAALGSACPACGQPAPASARFCAQCGARLPEAPAATNSLHNQTLEGLRALMPTTLAQKISATAAQILGERRDVTVVFVDIANLTHSAQGLDTEGIYLFVDEALRLLVDVVYKYEGTIDQFTGDGLMALFGAPVAHENDPERAVRAALEMLDVLQPVRQSLQQRHGLEFDLRVGINTGLVIAGQVGRDLHMEYTVIGDTVNLAARLQAAADPGTVLVSNETYQRTRPLFKYRPLNALRLAGLPEPIQAAQPLGLLPRPGRVRGLDGTFVAMIGRQTDLDRLKGALRAVEGQGESRVALVTGEAGLGKSRLVAEFGRAVRHAHLAQRPSGAARVRVYEGSCLAYARSRPLWVVADVLRSLLRVADSDPPELQRQALQGYLNYLGLAEDNLLPYLVYLLGLSHAEPEVEQRLRRLDPAMLQRQTHAALRQVLLAEAQRATTVLIFDDLHWVDPASQEFLEYLIETTLDAPLLIVLVSRDLERQTTIAPLIAAAGRRPHRLVDIQLQPLSPAEGQLLIDQLLGQPPETIGQLEQHIAARADGNPFFIEELVRMLIERGGLQRSGETWQAPAQAEELMQDVPGTLKGLILARFDRLPDGPRRRLQKAAVIGRSFPVGLLQQLDGDPPEMVETDLEALEARQFLVPEPFGGEAGYTFRHALVQEAVSSTLLKRDLQRIHEQIAQTIEQTAFWSPEEQTEVLAYHYAESQAPGRAVPYLIAAANNAARRYANRTAIQHYRRAITLMQDAAPGFAANLTRARLGLGKALKFAGQFGEAASVLAEAVREVQSTALDGDPQGLLLLTEGLRELADVRQREGAWDTAFAHLEAALAALGDNAAATRPALWRPLMDRMAWIRFRQGKLDEAFSLASRATLGLDPLQTEDPITLASLFNTLGGVCWQQGKLAQAAAYVQRSLNLYEGLRYSFGMANAYTNLGILNYQQGLWPQAAENFERSDKLRHEIGYMTGRAGNLKNVGLLRLAMGDHAQARRDLENSLAISQQLGEDYDLVQAELGLGQLAYIEGKLEEAAGHIQSALQRRESMAEDELVQAGWNWALILAERGDLPAGLESVEQALSTAREAGLAESEADCLRVLGVLQARAGQWDQAAQNLRASADLSLAHADRYRQGLALLELGRLAPAQRDRSHQRAAHSALKQAVELFDSLGAAYDGQQARAALAALEARERNGRAAPAGHGLRPPLPAGEWHPAAVVWVNLDPAPGADAEAVFACLAMVMPGLAGVVEAYQGQLIRRASGLMVVFGAQVAHEDDPVRAVQTALEVLDRLDAAAEVNGVELTVRVAVSAGNVVAGYVGGPVQPEFMVTGEPLQVAQQLAAAAPPGEVWVTNAVRNATSHQFIFRPLPSPIPGAPASLTGWALEAAREQPGAARGLPGVHLQLIGRETPLEAMTALAQNLTAGAGGLVWIEGEAGIGKSRLMREFAETAVPLGATVWTGQCTAQRAGHAFSLFANLLSRLFNLQGSDTAEQAREKIDQVVAGWPAEAGAVRPYLELLVGLRPFGPEGERLARLEPDPLRQQIYVALRQVLKSVAAQHPLIVVLDDLHWIDPLSADLLLFLSNLIATAPILFVCALRWDEAEASDDRVVKVQSLMRPDQVLRLHLDRLSERESERLLSELLAEDELPIELRHFVLKRSEGNPFYIEEVVRTLIEQEYLHRHDERWTIDLSVNLQELPLPASLGALIQARVDTLPPDLKHLLQCAAVIGGVFEEGLLARVAEHPAVPADLTRLEARGMLRRTTKAHQWQFNHSLIETAVYGNLLKVRRQALHGKVAEVLESLWGAAAMTYAAELAYHFTQARIEDKALVYLTAAAEQAASRYANEEALAYYQQAAELLTGGAEASDELRWRVAVGLGDVYRFVGEYPASQTALEMGLDLLERQAVSPVHRAGLYRRLGETAQKQGEFEASLQHLHAALDYLEPLGDDLEALAEAGRVMFNLAVAHMRQGRLEQARQACEASADYATRAGSTSDLAAVENLLGGIYYQLSHWEQASQHTRRAMALREQMGHTWGVAATSSNLGILAILAGDWEEAQAIFERSLWLREEIGDVEGVAIVHNNLGSLARDQGNLPAAEAHFRSSLERAAPLRMGYHAANASVNLADVLQMQGQLEAAEAELVGSLAQAEAIGSQELLCEIQRVKASLALARQDWPAAREAAQRSAELAAELGDRSLESAAWRVLSEAELQQGDLDAALSAVARAWQAIAGITSQLEAGRVAAQAGRISVAAGEADKARGYLLQAREVFARLGAGLDLRQVDGLLREMTASTA